MSDYVPEDLIAEIFERLPVKSLLRFMSLSKSWCSRISSPEFIHRKTLQSLYAPQKVAIARMIHKDFDRRILTLHSEDQLHMCHTYEECIGITTFRSHNLHMVGSCNGIMCLLDESNNTICLWNPSNRRKLTIHDCPYRMYESGFGFDPITGDYKIVRISSKTEAKHKSVVYSLKRRTWLEIDFPAIPISRVISRGYFLNGTLHWLVESVKRRCIVTLNLSTEVFGTIALESYWCATGLAIIQGSLGVTVFDKPCFLWVMKEYNNAASWCCVSDFGGHVRREVIESVGKLTNGDVLFRRKIFQGSKVYKFSSDDSCEVLEDVMKYDSEDYIETYVDSLALLDIGSLYWEHSHLNQPSCVMDKNRHRKNKKSCGQYCSSCY